MTHIAATESLLEGVLDTEEDLLMMYIQAFQAIYKREYLDRVLGYTWREEGMHQMNLRHEAELNELKKLHTQQKQELLDEMRRRKDKVMKISQRMKDHKKRRREFNDAESISQLMEFESNSVRSKECHLRGSFMITDDILTDNLSRINQPLTNQDGDFLHKDDYDPIGSQLLIDIYNAKSQVSRQNHPLDPKESTDKKTLSMCDDENLRSNINIESSKIILPVPIEQGSVTCSPISPNQHSTTNEGENNQKTLHQQNCSKQSMNVLRLNLTNGEHDKEEDGGNIIRTQRTIDSRVEETSFHRLGVKDEGQNIKGLSPISRKPRIPLDELKEQLEV